ncbi:RNA recognition motif [Trifolium medium]|uniref:RNA recognition motif n=1 Tax=Trifolium medium TaxID=97028 RepID=A0A392N766_9FABA|nr:RNA recognition motif [Trifolium medium]
MSISISRRSFYHDRQHWYHSLARDHDQFERHQSRYGREHDRRPCWYSVTRSENEQHQESRRWRHDGIWLSDSDQHQERRRRHYVDQQQNRNHGEKELAISRHGKGIMQEGNHGEKELAMSRHGKGIMQEGSTDKLGTEFKRYVSFYFTNFPPNLPRFYLWRGFEMCGMLEDVYVAKKRNKHGEPYGFVKFSNVRDITKLTNALNAVCFGHCHVRAKVANFDRKDANTGRNSGMEKGGLPKGEKNTERGVRNPKPPRCTVRDGDDDLNVMAGPKEKQNDEVPAVSVLGGLALRKE